MRSSLTACASAASAAVCPLPLTLAARVDRRPGEGVGNGAGGAGAPPLLLTAEATACSPLLSDSLGARGLSGGALLLLGSTLAAIACTGGSKVRLATYRVSVLLPLAWP